MQRRMFIGLFWLFATVTALVVSASVVAAAVACPVHDNSSPYFTGKTQTIDGRLMYEYKCVYGGGHTFWVRSDRQ